MTYVCVCACVCIGLIFLFLIFIYWGFLRNSLSPGQIFSDLRTPSADVSLKVGRFISSISFEKAFAP